MMTPFQSPLHEESSTLTTLNIIGFAAGSSRLVIPIQLIVSLPYDVM